MTYATFISSILIAFGPLFSLFVLVIAESSQLVILSIGGTFFWVLSILVSSILWYAVVPLRLTLAFIIPFSVLIQEAVRFGLWKLLHKSFQAEALRNDPKRPRWFMVALAVGWGMGFCSALVMHASILWNSLGPGDLPAPACPTISVFSMHALLSNAMALLHIAINIIAFDAFARKSWVLMAVVVLSHIAGAYFSLLTSDGGSCVGSLICVYGVLAVTAFIAWRLLLSNVNSLVRSNH